MCIIVSLLSGAHWVLPGCSPHQTSCPGICARSNRGFFVGSQQAVCGRTCTAPLVCTKREERWFLLPVNANKNNRKKKVLLTLRRAIAFKNHNSNGAGKLVLASVHRIAFLVLHCSIVQLLLYMFLNAKNTNWAIKNVFISISHHRPVQTLKNVSATCFFQFTFSKSQIYQPASLKRTETPAVCINLPLITAPKMHIHTCLSNKLKTVKTCSAHSFLDFIIYYFQLGRCTKTTLNFVQDPSLSTGNCLRLEAF